MSYLVLARKWRPQNFDEVVGQQAIAQTLANSIKLDRIGHAFLFSGPRGIGKTSTARILSKALNCETGPTATPCNSCRHCVEITAGNSLDVLEIDGASNRGIDEIRELRENVKYSPASARFKIIIIDEVHMLTREAFNALLKTLEEPPKHAKFILATTEAHKVPVTIVSRCQRYDFKRIDLQSMIKALKDICRKESVEVQDQTLEVLARIADGGLRDGLSLLDQVISFSGNRIDHEETLQLLRRVDPAAIIDILEALAAGDGAAVLDRFGNFVETGGDESVFNRELMEAIRDLMALKLGSKARTLVPEDLAEKFSLDQLERFFKVLLEMEISLRNSEHPRLVMDVALVKMSQIQALTPLSEIIVQLNQLTGGEAIPPRLPPMTRPVSRPAARPAAKPAARPAQEVPRPAHHPAPDPGQYEGNGNLLLKHAIAVISKSNPALGAALGFGSILQIAQSKVVIGFKPDNHFHMERINTRDSLPMVEKTISDLLSRPVQIIVEGESQDAPPSLADEEAYRKKKEQEAKLKLAMQSGTVAGFIREFGAKISGIIDKPHATITPENTPDDGMDMDSEFDEEES